MIPQTHSTPLVKRANEVNRRLFYVTNFRHAQFLMKSKDSPISFKLEKPAVMGACLGDLPRFGALDDQTLLPSLSDLSLQTEHYSLKPH